MSAYERWENHMESKHDPYSIELKLKVNIDGEGEVCRVRHCLAEAVSRYKIGGVSPFGSSSEIDLCRDHDSDEMAFDIYGREETYE